MLKPEKYRIALLYPALILFVISTFSACTAKEEAPEPAPERYTRTLRIGLIPEHNLFDQMQRYEPLASYISKKTGVGIELKVLSRYGNIITNFSSMELDGAFFGSFSYALAHERIAVETIARPETRGGVSSYYGMIFVRKESGISSAADMKGKRFAFVDKATTAGYLLPLKYFKDNGIDNYQTYLSETYFTGTHEDAIYDVLNGLADIGAAKNTVYYRLAHTDARIINELRILTRSPDVPENALAFRSSLDVALRQQIKDVLLSMEEDPEGLKVLKLFGVARFIETTNADYAPVFEYARAAGLDLKTYNWMND